MKSTNSILDTIVAHKKQSLIATKHQRPQAALERKIKSSAFVASDRFYNALKAEYPELKIIAEMKKASPSAGIFQEKYVLENINKSYQALPNIVALSVLTETEHFKGDPRDLLYAVQHNTHGKAILRKDFIFDPYQIVESKALGADAFLLIASLFTYQELNDLVNFGKSIGIEPFVEVHSEAELDMTVKTECRCIGANSRNLNTFKIDNKVHELLRDLDDSYVKIAESGISDPTYFRYLATFSNATLIGTYFMKSKNISAAMKALVGPLDGSLAA